MDIPQDCSWVWRSVLKARSEAARFIKYAVSNGRKTLLWHDQWCEASPLKFNSVAVAAWSDEFSENETVDKLIMGGRWNEQVMSLPDGDLRSAILKTVISRNLDEDRVVWILNSTGDFTAKSAYNALCNHADKVKWSRYVWGKWVQPKHSFCSWLAFSGSLLTEDRLMQRGVASASCCHLCGQFRENTKHLFFECNFSKMVLAGVKSVLNITTDTRSSNWEWKSILHMCKRKDIAAEIIKVYISATVYQIWTERNARKHNGKKSEAKVIIEKIVRDTKIYLQAQLTEVADIVSTRVLLDRIGVQVEFKPRQVLHCSWIAPAGDVIQLSCDGSVEKDRNGYGGLLRDTNGKPKLLYVGGSSIKSVITQELLAIWHGLKGAKMIGVTRIEVAAGSLRAVRMINKEEAPPWYCRDLLEGIVKLSRSFGSSQTTIGLSISQVICLHIVLASH